ncbi:Glu-tRNA(Gln) amidotransferase subunit GatE [Candidatus Nitrosotenuis cloacae]|uniref:Glu-tRNA(Gln) amidotransferase subunit GatE n=1 Tax=Candidatus Nitrosotenuis cloacae TaxID=1603555 RepID=UPI0022830857|nr:Glu-tRNA(Gln) amidotransferase subunit GatE [Candidatus Nitrosotenuis cloacae]
MPEIDIEKIGLRVGLEIHQQLATNKKLFCSCRPVESEEYPVQFSRRLRLAKSELGKYDPAAVFESSKSKIIKYNANPQSSCLVEYDDEPPHALDHDAKSISLIIASALHSNIFDETYVMRKIVIDGSNTSGFQRTTLISQGGYLQVDGERVGVQAVCLEEDAAKLVKDGENVREYALDRLSIPLVEIALAPVSGTPAQIKKIALTLGRLLRVTRKVARGIGSIRQDVNVSISGGGIVEVKGVQQLDQLEKVIMYEAQRQHGLQLIAERINSIDISKGDVIDVTDYFAKSKSKIILKSLKDGYSIKSLKVRNFAGMFGYEPYEGIRLGKELGQQVRFFGIGGIFHSDELPNYGIEQDEVDGLRSLLKAEKNDGFLIVAGPKEKIEFAVDAVINRIIDAKNGVPAETRAATQSGETVFLRPRPGSSRMYPETDIPPITVSREELQFAKDNVPKSWDEAILELQKRYGLNAQLAEQMFDSEYLDLFESICSDGKNNPNFVASILCSTITNLQRKGLDGTLLKPEHILRSFEMLAEEKIAKESLEMIYEYIMSGKVKTIEEFAEKHSQSINDTELESMLDRIISSNMNAIKSQGAHSSGMLMGLAMKSLRGKVSGEKISKMLTLKIAKILKE